MEYPEYYKILELPIDAESADIKRQYRKFAKKYHPDLHAGDKTAEEMFKKIKEAYETLIDENKRAAYDLEWKKQRDKEKKARKKEEKTEAQTATPQAEEKTPTPQKKTEKSPRKTIKKTRKKHYSFRILRLFLSLCVIFSVLLFSAPKIMENKQKIAESLPNFAEISSGLDGYFLKKEVINNEVGEVEKILQQTQENTDTAQDIANFKNADGYSLLMLSKTAQMSKMLIENGADVNYVAPDGESALLLAVKNSDAEMVRLLLEHNAEVNITEKNSGYNTLMLAESEEIAYLLLKAGANPNFVAKDGTTPLAKAAKEHNRERINLLGQFGAQINWSDVIKR